MGVSKLDVMIKPVSVTASNYGSSIGTSFLREIGGSVVTGIIDISIGNSDVPIAWSKIGSVGKAPKQSTSFPMIETWHGAITGMVSINTEGEIRVFPKETLPRNASEVLAVVTYLI